jgi:hypothetical protein
MSRTVRSLRTFALTHDGLPAFHAGYIVLTILVAALFTLGTFSLVIGAHMALDAVKYGEFLGLGKRSTARAVLREALPDIALLSVGLTFAVYFHQSFAIIAAASGLFRSVLTLTGAAGTTMPKFEIAHRFLRAIRNIPAYLRERPIIVGSQLKPMEAFSLFVVGLNIVLVIAAPYILTTSGQTIIEVIVREMQPW